MPKATLTFNLPDERSEYNNAMNGGKWRSIVEQIAQQLRNYRKYGHEFKTPDDAVEAISTDFWDACNEEGLDPWGE